MAVAEMLGDAVDGGVGPDVSEAEQQATAQAMALVVKACKASGIEPMVLHVAPVNSRAECENIEAYLRGHSTPLQAAPGTLPSGGN